MAWAARGLAWRPQRVAGPCRTGHRWPERNRRRSLGAGGVPGAGLSSVHLLLFSPAGYGRTVAADPAGVPGPPALEPNLDEDRACSAARAAAADAGIALDRMRLLRLGTNAVFVSGEVLVRVASAAASLASVTRSVDVARWLAHAGVPAVELLDVTQPVQADGLLVTFWRYLGADDRYGTTTDLARLLRRLHALEAPAALNLPDFDPFERSAARLADAAVPLADRQFLARRLDELGQSYAAVRFELEPGVIHGDANVGNVLVDDDGVARLSDLDGFAIGNREWDLVQTAMFAERFGWHTADEYEAFREVYGFDVMAWEGYPVLADLRELLMVTWLAWKAGEGPALADEAAKRIKALRTGASRRDWLPI